jgi:predicted dehydrogenase
MLGKMIMSQGSYHRNWNGKQQPPGEWNWPIDTEAGPHSTGDNHIDWKMWLGSAPKRPWNPDRFFRFRKYWDYSGGIATDLFYHVMAPLNLVWGEGEFPYRVVGTGGIYVFKDEREVPDTFMLVADYPSGHSVVLSSTMANSQHIPGLIRGHEGTLIMVQHGMFERPTDFITVIPERFKADEFKAKYGTEELKIPVEKTRPAGVAELPNGEPSRASHYDNFVDCMRSREQPVLNGHLAYKTMATIAMSVQSYREGKVLYFGGYDANYQPSHDTAWMYRGRLTPPVE